MISTSRFNQASYVHSTLYVPVDNILVVESFQRRRVGHMKLVSVEENLTPLYVSTALLRAYTQPLVISKHSMYTYIELFTCYSFKQKSTLI